MKKLSITLAFAIFSCSVFAQTSDTLIVPLGKYKFIKIGDNVYNVTTSIELSTPQDISTYPQQHFPYGTTYGTIQTFENFNNIINGIGDHMPCRELSIERFQEMLQNSCK